MIDLKAIETVIVDGLKDHLGCEVVMANQATPAPKYPYVSYTIVNPLVENNGTFGVYEDGFKRKEHQQVWSFTSQSNNDLESKINAVSAHEYFSEIGTTYLADHGISVQLVRSVSCRDNLLTVGYEYRNGFDVTFAFMDEIAVDQTADGSISGASISYDGETITPQDPSVVLDELNTRLEKRLSGEVD